MGLEGRPYSPVVRLSPEDPLETIRHPLQVSSIAELGLDVSYRQNGLMALGHLGPVPIRRRPEAPVLHALLGIPSGSVHPALRHSPGLETEIDQPLGISKVIGIALDHPPVQIAAEGKFQAAIRTERIQHLAPHLSARASKQQTARRRAPRVEVRQRVQAKPGRSHVSFEQLRSKQDIFRCNRNRAALNR